MLYGLDTLFSLISLAPGGWVVRISVLMMLVRGILAHKELDKVESLVRMNGLSAGMAGR